MGKNKGGKKQEDFKFDFANGSNQQSGEGKKEGQNTSVLDLAGRDAPMLAHFQKQLGALIGKTSGYLESLPKPVQERVKALKHLHSERVKLEKQFEKELQELEKKYDALYQPYTNRRFDIVTGVSEPKPEELVEEKKEEIKTEDIKQEKSEAKKEEGKQEEKDIKGVPEFWLLALKHHDDFGGMITERDEEALKHLTDIRVVPVEDSPDSFTIEFRFAPNDFFENDIIKKTYVLKENDIDGEVLYDHVESSDIKWKGSKNLTVKKVTKTQKKKGGRRGGRGGKGSGPATTVTVEEPTESFFHFFNPENAFQAYNGGMPEEEEGFDEEGGLQEFLEVDYELGLEMREKVIPHAVMWYTGENALAMLGGEDDEDDDEEDPDNEDDEDEDEEFQPPKEATAGQQQNPEIGRAHV